MSQHIEIKTEIDSVVNLPDKDIEQIRHIFHKLIIGGGLFIKGGNTTIHFDEEGNYKGYEIRYWGDRA